MSTVTKEWLQQTIAEYEANRDELPFGLDTNSAIELQAFKLALASLEAEAVAVTDDMAYAFHHALSDSSLGADDVEEIKAALRAAFANVTAPPAPVSVPDAMEMDDDFDSAFEHGKAVGWNAFRAAILQGAEHVTTAYKLSFEQWLSQQTGTIDVECGCVMTEVFFHWLRVAYEAGNSPAIPDGCCIMPKKLTAENGAKVALSGEFSETKFINCPECFGDDECETCDGSGRIEISVPVSWTTIKAIWAKGVEHFSEAPQQEGM